MDGMGNDAQNMSITYTDRKHMGFLDVEVFWYLSLDSFNITDRI